MLPSSLWLQYRKNGTSNWLLSYPSSALFVIATATVLLLFIGIHNAWDNVTYIAIELAQRENKRQE